MDDNTQENVLSFTVNHLIIEDNLRGAGECFPGETFGTETAAAPGKVREVMTVNRKAGTILLEYDYGKKSDVCGIFFAAGLFVVTRHSCRAVVLEDCYA